jgi:hypothetical protein
MTPVGHILTGVAIGVACMPEDKPKKWKAVFLGIFGVIANFPDFQLSYAEHRVYYTPSHSLVVNAVLILMLIAWLYLLKDLREKMGGWKVIIGGSLAWLSHLLLDTFYSNGDGLALFWPFSYKHISLPIPWFKSVRDVPPPFTTDTIHILLVEGAVYGTLLVIVILLRKLRLFPWTRAHPTRPIPEK